jgi:beta-galactosidase
MYKYVRLYSVDYIKTNTILHKMNTFYMPYKPGKLEAIGYKNKKQISEFNTETTTKPVALQLIAYKNSIENNGQDAVHVTIQAIDEKGRPVPTANLTVQFEISDQANIIGVGNGNPNSHESDKANHRNLFNGLAQVIIQSKEGKTGHVRLVAKAENLRSAVIEIKLVEVPVVPFVPIIK